MLGVGPAATPWLGATSDIAFIVAALAFLGKRPAWQGLIYGAALISPAVMMGIERGNNDYIVFSLVVAGLFLMLGNTVLRRISGTTLLLAAILLKLFPIFSAAVILLRRRRLLVPASILILAGALYFLTIRDTLDAIAHNTHREVFYSYGAEVAFVGLAKYFGVASAPAWKLPILGFVAAVALLLGFGNRTSFALSADRWGAGFATGAAIFLFSFCVASSFDYRLSFLLLALPQLMDWSADRGSLAQRCLARVTIAAILIALWLSFYSVKVRLIDEVFTWLTFFLLLAMMTAAGLRFLAWLPARQEI